MPTYIVKVKWTTYGEHTITAKDPAAALLKATAAGLPGPEFETGQDDYQVIDVVPESDPMETGELP